MFLWLSLVKNLNYFLKDIFVKIEITSPLLFSAVKYADRLNDFIATSLPEEKHCAWYTQAVIPLPILRIALNKLWKPSCTMYLWPNTLEKCSSDVLDSGLIKQSIGLQFLRQMRMPCGSPTLPGASTGFLII